MIRQRINIFQIVLISALVFISKSYSANLNSIQLNNSANSKTILCKIFGDYKYTGYILHSPERVVLDLKDTRISFDVNRLNVENNIIKGLRVGHPNQDTLRLVFDLKQQAKLAVLKLRTGQSSESILKLEVTATGKTSAVTVNKPSTSHSVPIASAPRRNLRDVIVIIDPGHGGKDPGAIGARRSQEKNVVLLIAKRLKTLIDRQPGMRAVLTRNGDYYVGLRERMEIARKYNGDLFVAIHADAFGNHNSHGASVFALSQGGATSEAARWLAEKENYSELGGVNLSSLDDKNGVIRTVLIDLSQTATINASLNMGKDVLMNLNKITSLHSRKVEQARFMVLKSPDIPSVLIETGFISNLEEEKNLTSPYYQDRLTRAIFAGINSYFWSYPPYGSRIEAMSMVNRKVVSKNLHTNNA